jgi:hypothetical protein
MNDKIYCNVLKESFEHGTDTESVKRNEKLYISIHHHPSCEDNNGLFKTILSFIEPKVSLSYSRKFFSWI